MNAIRPESGLLDMRYTVTIPGDVRGKQRPRATKGGHLYTPQETVNAEAWVKQCAIDQGVFRPLLGPVSLTIAIQRAVPQSWSKRDTRAALDGARLPTGRPDADNICKTILDALNGIAWRDDAQIVELIVRKRYAPTSFTTLVIEQL